jgi:hypothetical protein
MVASFSKAKLALEPAGSRYGKLNSELLLSKFALCISFEAIAPVLIGEPYRFNIVGSWIYAHFLSTGSTAPINFPTTNPAPDRLGKTERPLARGHQYRKVPGVACGDRPGCPGDTESHKCPKRGIVTP